MVQKVNTSVKPMTVAILREFQHSQTCFYSGKTDVFKFMYLYFSVSGALTVSASGVPLKCLVVILSEAFLRSLSDLPVQSRNLFAGSTSSTASTYS
jgi:hypothetical protein